ncbi:type VI secretion system baseplate subunit TssG [Hymenobacter negativus]|uniref:Type VI secretion system baseplate subunit TssG n=1 Tax=Hymenobacter negativus TaxID=2795026 RepID=A0ABS3QP07_9BACT|nr:type VI secretion system baseplate subunit TssG [Hymenobacter negativus]MBO2013019.1 type VI secretion system baseplate subunit TssG [Hymenobacter negativus]
MTETISVHHLLARLRRQPFDLRLEVIMAELLAYGYAFDDFLVRPVGLFARRYRRDLGTVSDEPFERGSLPVVRTVLELHREGMYDALPQQVFHQPGITTHDPSSGVRAMVEDIRLQRRKEKATRLFFLPFEQEFFRMRVRIEQEERRYFTNLSAHWYNEALARFWGIADCGLPPGPLTNLLYLLPLAHSITGDLPRTQLYFESVLGRHVQLRTIEPQLHALPTATVAQPNSSGTLGNLALGRDLVLGGDYQETLPALEISLHGLSVADLEAYLAGEWPAKALALLCEYFVPFETDVVVRYEMATVEPSFYLGEGEDAPVLGFTTAGI